MAKQETYLDLQMRNTWNGWTPVMQEIMQALCAEHPDGSAFTGYDIQLESDDRGLDVGDVLANLNDINVLGFRVLEAITKNEKRNSVYHLSEPFLEFVRKGVRTKGVRS